MDDENLFLNLYEDVLPTAEYLQADSKYRNLLPEAVIIAGMAFALKAFAQGFFEGLGSQVAAEVSGKVRSWFQRSEESGKRDPMLEGLGLMRPFLVELPKMDVQHRMVLRDAISSALQNKGYPPDVAEETASKLIVSLTSAGEAQLL